MRDNFALGLIRLGLRLLSPRLTAQHVREMHELYERYAGVRL